MSIDDVRFDWQRGACVRFPEVVYAEAKSIEQLCEIAGQCIEQTTSVLFTRVQAEKALTLTEAFEGQVHYERGSSTLRVGEPFPVRPKNLAAPVAIVAGGTADRPIVDEIEKTLAHCEVFADSYLDVGVAGLWRLTELAPELQSYRLIIAVAGMEGALFSVLAGLVPAPVIAVPASVGYGVGADGQNALQSALGSCSPGIAVVNIDNGFGAAALAVKFLSP